MNTLRLRHILFCIAFIVLCCIGIFQIRFVDNSEDKGIVQNIILQNDSGVVIDFTNDEEMYFDSLIIDVSNINDLCQIYFELVDEDEYVLNSGSREVDNLNISMENHLDKDKKYTLQLEASGLTETDLNAKISIKLYGYKSLGNIYKVVLILFSFMVIGLFIMIKTNNPIYNKVKSWLKARLCNNNAPTALEYFIIGAAFVVLFMSNAYGDTLAFVHYEVNFWRCVFHEGGIRNFYEYSYKMWLYYKANGIGGAFSADYDFPLYIAFAIWGLPLYFVCDTLGIEETSNMWTIVYGKAIFCVALIIAAYVIYKICCNLEIEKKQSKWSVFIFVSSILVLVDVAYIGQLDILGIVFTLLGIYYFQKQNKWKFILFFMIATSFKVFPFFIFVPLLLLMEKNIFKIGIDSITVFGFSKVASMLFPSDTMAIKIKDEFSSQSLEALLGVKAPLYNDTVPIIVLVIGAVCIYCYLKKIKSQKEWKEYSIFMPLLTMFLLMISFDSTQYWYIQLAPYVAIMLMYNSKQYNNLILFETVGMICLTLCQFGANYWCFHPANGKGMLLSKLFGDANVNFTMETFAAYTRLDVFSGALYAAFVLFIGTFILLSRPGKIESDDKVVVRPYALLRMVANIAIAYIPIILYVINIVLYK